MSAAPARLGVALWAANLAAPLASVDDWVAEVDATMARVAGEGADVLVMPEYACARWLQLAPPGLAVDRHLEWLAARGEAALAALGPLPARHGVALLAGTMPVFAGGAGALPRNRAHLLLPDGRVAVHDKLCLIPDEREPAGWNLATGDAVRVIEWRGVRVAVLICLDVELPALVAPLAHAGVDLVLVPSMTARASGHHRVRACARARAVELYAAVCTAGTVGPVPGVGSNFGGAGVYLPCETALGDDGVAAEIAPLAACDGPGPLLVARDLPLDAIRARRGTGAEVWPGAWDAGAVRVIAED